MQFNQKVGLKTYHFFQLLDEVIGSGNDRWAIYLWCWFAHIVQFSEEKPEVQDCVSRRIWLQEMDELRKKS